MKTIYKHLSFLSLGLFLNIYGASSHTINGDGQNSILINNDNKASTLIRNDSENNVFEFNAYSFDVAKGGHSGCSVYKYEYKNGVLLPASKTRYNLYTYNDKGNPTEHIYYDPASSRSDKETFTYNEKGKLTEQVTYFKNGSVCEKTTYKYDAKDNLNEIIWYESGYRLMNRETYRYDKQNNIIEGTHYIGRDTLVGSDTYQYNENGKITGHKSFNSEGIVRDIDTYEYDANDYLIEKKMHSGEPSVCRTFVYKNNDMGNLTLKVELQMNQSSVKKDVYVYDANGKMTKHITFDKSYLVTDTFDPNGNKVETTTSYKGITSGKSTYSYDVNGNLIDEIMYNQLNEAYGRMQYVYF
jgi:hypothetical protein